MRPLTSIPRVTAGLIWQPEIGPTANAMASRDSPKAMATPTLPTFAPAITAVVNPAKTRTNVPNNSAAYFIMTFTSGEFRCQNKQPSHAKVLATVGANSICKKHQRKCQREFYMAQSVLARIRTGAEGGTGTGLGSEYPRV